MISGESGAGKTESAKLFIKQIIALSNSGSNAGSGSGKGLEEKIVALNPLLESYGNAQTLRNDNSSRFGKFIELRFNDQIQIEVSPCILCCLLRVAESQPFSFAHVVSETDCLCDSIGSLPVRVPAGEVACDQPG